MARTFERFLRELEDEATREGPKARAELAAFDAHFRLAAELLTLRQSRRLTQRQLAERSGVQQSEISRIEAAHANPTISTVAALARGLDAEIRIVPRASRVAREARTRRSAAPARRRSVASKR